MAASRIVQQPENTSWRPVRWLRFRHTRLVHEPIAASQGRNWESWGFRRFLETSMHPFRREMPLASVDSPGSVPLRTTMPARTGDPPRLLWEESSRAAVVQIAFRPAIEDPRAAVNRETVPRLLEADRASSRARYGCRLRIRP